MDKTTHEMDEHEHETNHGGLTNLAGEHDPNAQMLNENSNDANSSSS